MRGGIWSAPTHDQGLLLALCSGVIPGGLKASHGKLRINPGSALCKAKSPAKSLVSLLPVWAPNVLTLATSVLGPSS